MIAKSGHTQVQKHIAIKEEDLDGPKLIQLDELLAWPLLMLLVLTQRPGRPQGGYVLALRFNLRIVQTSCWCSSHMFLIGLSNITGSYLLVSSCVSNLGDPKIDMFQACPFGVKETIYQCMLQEFRCVSLIMVISYNPVASKWIKYYTVYIIIHILAIYIYNIYSQTTLKKSVINFKLHHVCHFRCQLSASWVVFWVNSTEPRVFTHAAGLVANAAVHLNPLTEVTTWWLW